MGVLRGRCGNDWLVLSALMDGKGPRFEKLNT